MDVFLCGRTALDVYFLGREVLGPDFYSRMRRVEVRSLEGCAHTARQVAGCELGFLRLLHTGKVDVLVPSRRMCHRSTMVRHHVWSSELPGGAFLWCAPSVYIASPEFLALTLADEMDRYSLLQLCMQLCGTYANSLTAPHGMVKHPKLSNRDRMWTMAEYGAHHPGRNNFIWAARHVMEGAASHTEAGVALLHTMPWQVGGFALRAFVLNRRVDYDEPNRQATGADRCYVDLFDEPTGFGWEYQGEEGHSDVDGAVPYDTVNRARAAGLWGGGAGDPRGGKVGGSSDGDRGGAQGGGSSSQISEPKILMSYGADQLENDTRKFAALRDLGYDVRPLVWGQIATVGEFDRVARVTAERLGVDIGARHAFSEDPEMLRRRVKLHRGLLLRRFYWERL